MATTPTTAAPTPTRNVDPIWEDQGLYFTLIFNAIVVTVIAIVAYIVHSRPMNARILRPNRPGSRIATFFLAPNAAFEMAETEVMENIGVRPMFYLLTIKFMFYLFLFMCVTSALIVALCATDDYLNEYRFDEDPDSCRDKSQSDCEDHQRCEYLGVAGCQPSYRRGLFDFTTKNIAPKSWRLYVFAIGVVLCVIPIILALRAVCRITYNTIRASFTRPVFKGLKYGGMSTVGARTVIVGGLPNDGKILTSSEAFMSYLKADKEGKVELLKEKVEKKKKSEGNDGAVAKTDDNEAPSRVQGDDMGYSHRAGGQQQQQQANINSTGDEQTNNNTDERREEGSKAVTPREPLARANSDGAAPAATSSASKEITHTERCRRLGEPANLKAPSWELAERAKPETINFIREAPDDLVKHIELEKEIIQALTDAYAAEEMETDPEKKPVKKRLIPQLWKQVPAVEYETNRLKENREKLDELLAKRPEQDLTGAVILTFDRASTAYAFVRSYNDEQGITSPSRATIAGPRNAIVWENLKVTAQAETARFVIMVIIFTLLVFLWSIPVGFLGSFENLGTIPGIGPAISSAFSVLPKTFLGTLGAYLPTIVITIFNILLPVMFRFFGRIGGVKTTDAVMREVVLMCAIFSIMTGIVMQAAFQGGLTQFIALVTNPSGDAVIALIIAIVSPSGGYWYSFLITAACLGIMLGLLEIGPLIISTILGKASKGRQEEYDRLFAPREWDHAYQAGRHIFFCAIGLLFHGTVAFLQPFAAIYAGIAYFVERSRIIDGSATDDFTMLNYSYFLTSLHTILALHTIAAIGNVAIAALKLSIGAPIIAAVALVASIGMHVYVRMYLRDLIQTTPEMVAAVERDADDLNLPREQVEDVERYVPEYSNFEIDRNAETKIKAMSFEPADKTWPKPGTELHEDPPAHFLCFGAAAVKQQSINSLSERVHTLEKENDRLREFYTEAHQTAAERQYGDADPNGSNTNEPYSPGQVAVQIAERSFADKSRDMGMESVSPGEERDGRQQQKQ